MIEDAQHNWEEKKFINRAISDLHSLKIDEMHVDGDLAKSKIAWKIKKLSQSFVHRLCELSDSCYLTWASHHHVSSLILARAIIETCALLWDIEEKIAQHLATADLEDLNKIVMQRTFSTRIKEMVGTSDEYKAINILSLIQKHDKKIPGFLSAYENLSEAAHPNYFGVSQAYGNLNTQDGSVVFGEARFLKAMFSSISCAYAAIAVSCDTLHRLEEDITKVARLQHRMNPVKK